MFAKAITAAALALASTSVLAMAALGELSLSAAEYRAAGPRVDLNQDTPRGDVVSPAWENWKVAAGAKSSFRVARVGSVARVGQAGQVGRVESLGQAGQVAGAGGGAKDGGDASAAELEFELAALDADKPLDTAWWRPGFDYPARMASDGVVCRGPIRLTVRGLSAGRHSIGTWHNGLTDATPSPIRIVCKVGAIVVSEATVRPTKQVERDDASAGGYVEFDVKDGQAAEIDFMPQDGGGVVLNGLEVDRSDPRRRALQPNPADDDEHAVKSPVLSWAAATGAVSHHVYVGTSYDAVARATQRSPEFRGATNTAEFKTESLGLTHRDPAYWRIDEVFGDGDNPTDVNGGGNRIERGEVWRFQIRRLAFSQAEGYGRFAIGGRAGRVIEVVNLDDGGPGSLRAAVEAAGPRTVVFRVGGLIALQSKLIVRNPYLTIAGQTAPGDGICVKNFTFGCSDTHDVIIRHMRIRVGDESKLTQDGSGARGSDHVIYDHCSISWSIDEGFSSREARNLTVQRCLIAEALHLADHKKYMGTGKGHSFAGSISGNIGSFHHNLLAHCTGRNWSLAGGLDRTGQRLAGRLDIRNNVVFNWRDRTTDGGVRELCFVDNLYLPGPATTVHSLLKPDRGDADRGMRAFMAGNRIEGRARESVDNWSAFVGTEDDRRKIQVDAPLWPSHVTAHPTDELLENVLRDVGATRPARDAVDRRIIDDVRRRGATFSGSKGKLPGIIDSQADAGGWPEYRSGDPPRDTDHDGLPDDWEVRQGLNPRSPADASRYAPGGFTYLELYLEELASGEEMNRR